MPPPFCPPAGQTHLKKSPRFPQNCTLQEVFGVIKKDVCTGAHCVVPVAQRKRNAHAPGLAVWPPFIKSELLKLKRRMKTTSSNPHFMCNTVNKNQMRSTLLNTVLSYSTPELYSFTSLIQGTFLGKLINKIMLPLTTCTFF